YIRFVVTNAAGVAYGTNQSFTTQGPAPLVETLGVSDIGYASATLLGTSPLYAPDANYFFEWGTSPAYGRTAPITFLNSSLHFDGLDDIVDVGKGKFPD